jgi:hypothetical protein
MAVGYPTIKDTGIRRGLFLEQKAGVQELQEFRSCRMGKPRGLDGRILEISSSREGIVKGYSGCSSFSL